MNILTALPELEERFTSFLSEASYVKHLSAREKAIVQLTAALITGAKAEVKGAVMTAKQAMVTSEEIAEITGLIAATQMAWLQNLTAEENDSSPANQILVQSECCR